MPGAWCTTSTRDRIVCVSHTACEDEIRRSLIISARVCVDFCVFVDATVPEAPMRGMQKSTPGMVSEYVLKRRKVCALRVVQVVLLPEGVLVRCDYVFFFFQSTTQKHVSC